MTYNISVNSEGREVKKCSGCKKFKSVDDFNIDRQKKSGLTYRCRDCTKEYNITTEERRRLKHRNDPRSRMLATAKVRASKRGHEFNLKVEDIQVPATCPVLGLVLEAGNKNSPSSPSLDRINNDRGYLPDNVWVISQRANGIKSDCTIEELKAVLHWMIIWKEGATSQS